MIACFMHIDVLFVHHVCMCIFHAEAKTGCWESTNGLMSHLSSHSGEYFSLSDGFPFTLSLANCLDGYHGHQSSMIKSHTYDSAPLPK